jgi:hypothetical protein
VTPTAREVTDVNTYLLKCPLEVEHARAFWSRVDATSALTATSRDAFDDYWFGARSLPRVAILLRTLRARFAPFPAALDVLHRWPHMAPDTRSLICHWHVALTDPLYRRFTSDFLVARRASHRPEVTRDLVVGWVATHGPANWTMVTRVQLASKLLSAAHEAGLVATPRDPRPVSLPRVPDLALEYLLHLLRETSFEGTLLANPYTDSVGLDGALLEDRLRALPSLAFRRQGDLIDFGWRHADLRAWAAATFPASPGDPLP